MLANFSFGGKFEWATGAVLASSLTWGRRGRRACCLGRWWGRSRAARRTGRRSRTAAAPPLQRRRVVYHDSRWVSDDLWMFLHVMLLRNFSCQPGWTLLFAWQTPLIEQARWRQCFHAQLEGHCCPIPIYKLKHLSALSLCSQRLFTSVL